MFYPAFICAQVADTTYTSSTDTIECAKKENSSKAVTIIGTTVPLLMITYGIISLENPALINLDYNTQYELNEDNYLLHNKIDDFLQFSPAAAAFGMNLLGVKSKHKLSDMLILYALSNALETGIVRTGKTIIPRSRPDVAVLNSFPSGHAASAFIAAEFLHQEYGYLSVWISIGGYTMATLIGASRIFNDRHWVSDVIAGAGIGILSTKVIYWTYPYLKKIFGKKESNQLQSFIYPAYSNSALCLTISHHF
jgi:hypothetical protein